MTLEVYNKKRKFENTPEPKGISKKSSKKLIFVIHEHHASHLHWDLRLEMNGALASWAIPKTPEELKEKGWSISENVEFLCKIEDREIFIIIKRDNKFEVGIGLT